MVLPQAVEPDDSRVFELAPDVLALFMAEASKRAAPAPVPPASVGADAEPSAEAAAPSPGSDAAPAAVAVDQVRSSLMQPQPSYFKGETRGRVSLSVRRPARGEFRRLV
jgi:hypothetical protein